MAEKYFGETIRIGNTFYDLEGVLYDPTTISLAISDPEGTVIKTVTFAADEIKKTSVGVFYYDYDIPATGVSGYWVASWEIEITAKCDISEIQFFVKDVAEKLYCSVATVKAKLGASKMTMTDDDIRQSIREAMGEVDQVVGRTFTNANEKVEWFSTDQPNPNYAVNKLFLTYLPVQNVTTLEEYDTSKTLVNTVSTADYWVDTNGIVELTTDTFTHQRNRVKITYTYGYSSVPIKVSKLCSVIAQINVLLEYMIQQDSAITAYSVGDINTSIGESYVTTERAMARLEKEKATIIKEIGNLRTDIFIV
jgi:hypothetical protein